MTAPTVSVLMPAYNAEAYVADAVASILRQTFVDLELLGDLADLQGVNALFDDHRLLIAGSFLPVLASLLATLPFAIRWTIASRRLDRKSTRLNSSHIPLSRMPSSA